jgi:alkylation response protein AidB-like acyl-CoA dehydrogenase
MGLAEWRSDPARNVVPRQLEALVRHHAGDARWDALSSQLDRFAAVVATVIEPAVKTLERPENLPRHVAYDAFGNHVERIEFHPAYEVAGTGVWDSGLLACNRNGDRALEQTALFYLLSHVGEGGHGCPAVCTAGLARALDRRGSPAPALPSYIDGLYCSDYATCLRGSQFLTEVQGGSDVGANEMHATPDGVSAWRLTGEKWFCSVADAELFAITARPRGAGCGTRGLTSFLVPRTLDGVQPNGFRIRRLKDKLGTRCMASAEIEFSNALAWPIGELDEGFHVAVEELLNTSRWLNAVGSTGLMRRAYLEASTYAVHRTAFGRSIGTFPAVRALLASVKVAEHAALASTLAVAHLRENLDIGSSGNGEVGAFRVLVNANKFVTSLWATEAIHRCIEVLGGNGTIEDFSPLPRLYRDSLVYESWEGSHNVLCAQIQRDLGHPAIADECIRWLKSRADGLGSDHRRAITARLDILAGALLRDAEGGDSGSIAFREDLVGFVETVQATELLRALSDQSARTFEQVATDLLSREATSTLLRDLERIDMILGDDLDSSHV